MGINERVYKIEIYNKITDPQSNGIKKDILDLGIKNIKEIKTAQLYRIKGNLTIGEIKTITLNILVDPVTQDYFIFKEKNPMHSLPHKSKKGLHSIEVWYKKGVTDPTAEATCEAIKDMNLFKNLKLKINTGMKYMIYGKLKSAEIKEIVTRLLANNLIQEYKIL